MHKVWRRFCVEKFRHITNYIFIRRRFFSRDLIHFNISFINIIVVLVIKVMKKKIPEPKT